MSDGSKIQWTDATWNPIRAMALAEPGTDKLGWHCERVSPGCEHCYAETLNQKRFGTGLGYTVPNRAKVEVYLDEATLTKPLHWTKPRKVFVCSMTDLFGEWVPDEYLDRVFAVMALSPQHTFQLLTKRTERMRAYLSEADRRWNVTEVVFTETVEELIAKGQRAVDRGVYVSENGLRDWPLPNVWLGVSAEDQQRWDERIPELLATPAVVRFVSCEPLLGAIEMERFLHDSDCVAAGDEEPPLGACICNEPREDHISWVIVGGESGPHARPCDIEWVRDVVWQCRAAGVACFVKQLGAKPTYATNDQRAFRDGLPLGHDVASWWRDEDGNRLGHLVKLRDRHGGDPEEWPADLRVREFPGEMAIAR